MILMISIARFIDINWFSRISLKLLTIIKNISLQYIVISAQIGW